MLIGIWARSHITTCLGVTKYTMDDNGSSTKNRCHHFVLDLAVMIFCSHYCVELKLFYFLLWSVCRERGRDFSDVLPVYNQTRQISILIYPAFCIYCMYTKIINLPKLQFFPKRLSIWHGRLFARFCGNVYAGSMHCGSPPTFWPKDISTRTLDIERISV